MPETVITLKDVWFSYNGAPVLSAIELDVPRNAFLAVIGPNGGGKTTLIKLLLGVYRPQRGSITVLGLPPDKAARRIGYVPQDTSANREFPVTVADVVRMGCLGMRSEKKSDDIVRAMLEKVGMWEFRDRKIGDLSGGQRQRVFIARALAVEPEILILDEPTANVDLEGQMKIYSVLGELNKEITVIVATHDITGVLGNAGSMAYVNRTLHTHDAPQMSPELFEKLTGTPFEHICPVELISRMLNR